MDSFSGGVAIVTGGASGIGRGICEALARRGATVVVADINAEGAHRVAEQIGGVARAAEVNTADADAVQRLVDGTVAEHGRLDYMFNNAGIGIGGDYREMTLDHWRRIVDVNLWGVIHGTHAAYRVMVERGSGHIINTASLAGLVPAGIETLYVTTKFAVVGLSLSLRSEAEALGVKVSVVCPGLVRTGIFDAATMVGIDSDALFAQLPTRMVSPERAGEIILDGVARNRAYIVFPLVWRCLWWLYRLHPAVLNPLGRKLIADVRKLRTVA